MKKEHIELKTLSARLNYALEIIGTKKADLARAIQVKPQVIQFLCTSETQSSRFTFEIATALGLNTRWLATGAGTMFVADDPKKQFFKSYKNIPLLSLEDVRTVFLAKKSLDESKILKWIPLETDSEDIFALNMPDTSMEPYIPSGSTVFIRQCDIKNQDGAKIIIAYLFKLDTIVIRELVHKDQYHVLTPKNEALFKEVILDCDVKLLGVVTDCLWHIRN